MKMNVANINNMKISLSKYENMTRNITLLDYQLCISVFEKKNKWLHEVKLKSEHRYTETRTSYMRLIRWPNTQHKRNITTCICTSGLKCK